MLKTEKKKKPSQIAEPIRTFAEYIGDQIATVVLARMESVVGASIDRLGAVAAKKIMGRLSTALPLPSPSKRTKAPLPTAKTAKQGRGKTAVSKAPPAAAQRGKKRSQEEVEEVAKKILMTIEKHPGLTIERLAAIMAVSTLSLQLPLSRLFGLNSRRLKVAAPRLRSEGRKRGTTYWPVINSAAPPSSSLPEEEGAPLVSADAPEAPSPAVEEDPLATGTG